MCRPQIAQRAAPLRERRATHQANDAVPELPPEPARRLRRSEKTCRVQRPPAERSERAVGGGCGQGDGGGALEAGDGLPSLPDLLDELDAEVDIGSLEQLTQSLLQDIARDLEAAAEKADCEVSSLLIEF